VIFSNAAVVTGVVRRHTGAPVTVGGTIRLQSIDNAQPFVNQLVNFGNDGSYRFPVARPGSFSLLATLNLLPGQNGSDTRLSGTVNVTTAAAQTSAQDVVTPATGNVTGTIRSATNNLVPNALVEIVLNPNPLERRFATSGTGGVFVFPEVPAGTYTMRATDPATSLIATVTVTVLPDQTVTQDIQYLITNSVRATVRAADGSVLQSATVYIQRSTATNFAFVGGTNAQGQATATNVPGGAFTIRAENPLDSQVVGLASGTVTTHGLTQDVAVTVPNVSTLRIQARDEEDNPIASVRVDIRREGLNFFQTGCFTDATGRCDIHRVSGAYTLSVQHPTFGSASQTLSGTIAAQGQTILVDVVMPGSTTISGVVRDRDGNPVPSRSVRIDSERVTYAAFAFTDANGAYTSTVMPVGPFRATVTDSQGQRFGAIDGDTRVSRQADITLDGVYLSTILEDGNGNNWQIQPSGIIGGTFGSANRYTLRARLDGSTSDTFFNGEQGAIAELGGRQLAITEVNLLGMRATRKVYVPDGGYFVRYLEIFDNRGAVPRTFDVSGAGEHMGTWSHTVQATSSGDAEIDVNDRWWVTGRPGRSFVQVVSGPGAMLPVVSAQGTVIPNRRYGIVTLQPGEKMAVLHFVTHHDSDESGVAVAERLVQLPPEALEGLTAEERAIIRNFDVPADGTSTLAPFPLFTGRALDADLVTPVAGVPVTVTTPNPFLQEGRTVTTDAAGVFAVRYPAGPTYTLNATDPVSGLRISVTRPVPDGATEIQGDIILSTAGSLVGTVRTAGTAVTTGTVRLREMRTGIVRHADIAADGSYTFGGLMVGLYEVQATSAGRTSGTLRVTVEPGQPTTFDLELSSFIGSVSVRLFAGDGVTPYTQGFLRVYDAFTGEELGRSWWPVNGAFSVSDIAPGAAGYTVLFIAYDGDYDDIPYEFAGTFDAPNDVVEYQVVVPLNIVRGTARYDDGAPVVDGEVEVAYPHPGGWVDTRWAETTADGEYTLFDVPPTSFTLRVVDAGQLLFLENSATMPSNPPVVTTMDVTLPPSGTVTTNTLSSLVTLSATNGHSYASRFVGDVSAPVIFPRVPFGRFSVQSCPEGQSLQCVSASGVLSAANPAATVALTGPAPDQLTRVDGEFVDADGTLAGDRYLFVQAGELTPNGSGQMFVFTDAAGRFTAPGARAGLISLLSPNPVAYAMTVTPQPPAATTTLNLVAGTAVDTSWRTVTATNGMQFTVSCSGGLGDARDVNGMWTPAFRGAYHLAVNGNYSFCQTAARDELAGRQIHFGPAQASGVELSRKVYVPEDGSFVRYLDVVRHPAAAGTPSAVPVTVDVTIGGVLFDPLRTVRSAASTGNTYAVFDDANGDSANRPVIAEVYGQAAAPVTVAAVYPQRIGGSGSVTYSVTVAPGETVMLLRFVVMRAPGQTGPAEAQAQALRDLSDPAALAGLTLQERAAIRNFVVP
jgi:hypothetical protein